MKFAIATTAICTVLMFFPELARADLADELEGLVGYSIVDSRTIVGWYDDDEKEEGSFNGCSHGRVIKFSDGSALTCAEYGYMYAYRPTAIILAKKLEYGGKSHYDIKMVVEDEVFDMR